MSTEQTTEIDHAESNGRAWLQSIHEMVEALEDAEVNRDEYGKQEFYFGD